jgi:hypothetical protein
MFTDEQITRFLSKIEKVTESGCWIWTGTVDKNGYGHVLINYKTLKAHRLSWLIHNGEIPAGQLVCHRCDVPGCVNPHHLFVGTQSDNMQDMHRKKRHTMRDKRWVQRMDVRGAKNPNAKFTEDDVRYIRSSTEKATDLARKYGVHRNRIYEILKRQTWKEI